MERFECSDSELIIGKNGYREFMDSSWRRYFSDDQLYNNADVIRREFLSLSKHSFLKDLDLDVRALRIIKNYNQFKERFSKFVKFVDQMCISNGDKFAKTTKELNNLALLGGGVGLTTRNVGNAYDAQKFMKTAKKTSTVSTPVAPPDNINTGASLTTSGVTSKVAVIEPKSSEVIAKVAEKDTKVETIDKKAVTDNNNKTNKTEDNKKTETVKDNSNDKKSDNKNITDNTSKTEKQDNVSNNDNHDTGVSVTENSGDNTQNNISSQTSTTTAQPVPSAVSKTGQNASSNSPQVKTETSQQSSDNTNQTIVTDKQKTDSSTSSQTKPSSSSSSLPNPNADNTTSSSSSKSKGSSVVPIAVGLGAAVAGGIGIKALHDHRQNSKFDDQNEDSVTNGNRFWTDEDPNVIHTEEDLFNDTSTLDSENVSYQAVENNADNSDTWSIEENEVSDDNAFDLLSENN